MAPLLTYLSLVYGKQKAGAVLSDIERRRRKAVPCTLSEGTVLLSSGPVPDGLAGLVQGILLDMEVNSVPPSHPWFQRCLKDDPGCLSFFVRCDPYGEAGAQSLTAFETPSGQRWYRTTGGGADLNYRNPAVLLSVLDALLSRKAAALRLLHAPLLWGRAHLPEAHALVRVMRAVLGEGTLLALDVDDSPAEDGAYFGDGDEAHLIQGWPFALLAAHSILSGDARPLNGWTAGLPPAPGGCARLFSTSGALPLRHVRDLLTESAQDRLLEAAKSHGGRAAAGVIEGAFIDLVSSLGDPDPVVLSKYLLSQAMLLAMPGVPLLSLPDLHGSRNNPRLTSLKPPVFEGMRRMLAARAKEPDFSPLGACRVLDLDRTVFALERQGRLLLLHNVDSVAVRLRLRKKGSLKDLLSSEIFPGDKPLELGPYGFRWLKPV